MPTSINQTITQTSELSKKIPEASKIELRITNQTDSTAPAQSVTKSNDEVTHRRPMIKDIPFYQDPKYRSPSKPIRTPMTGSSWSSESTDIDPEINIDFEENSWFQEGIISETYQRPDKSFFQESWELETLINTGNLVQKFLPKQADIDKILKVIHKKVLKGTHLPVMIKEIQAGYLITPYRWVLFKPDFLGAWKFVWFISNLTYQS